MNSKKQIEQYEHLDKDRANNPHVGLVTPSSDPDTGEKKTYEYDPHLDPQLQWAGKAEHTSFEVPTVSLHVHERIDPKTIIESVKKDQNDEQGQISLFSEKKPLREAIDFYKHKQGWTNRLIAGDSLLVMNSLLEKEAMAGKVQMFYFDPPYGIKYGSNFQPFVNNKDVKDGNDNDLSSEPETIKAFRDTWELGIHSYLSFLRDRLLLARDLLTDSGSIFVQISDDNVHHVRELLDELFGVGNFITQITYRTKNRPLGAKLLETQCDYIVWYAYDKNKVKYNQLFKEKDVQGDAPWKWLELADGTRRRLKKEEMNNHAILPKKSRVYRTADLRPAGFNASCVYDFEFNGKIFSPPGNSSWITSEERLKNVANKGYLQDNGNTLERIIFLDDFPIQPLMNNWHDTVGAINKKYVVQTSEEVIKRCILMSTDPGDIVFDPTCGSGTSAFVSEKYGRRWITCDSSRVSITLSKQRLMTANFDYYKLAREIEGVSSGFEYKIVPHITLKCIANDDPPMTEALYDQPQKDAKKSRVSGPFTLEAVPAHSVKSVDELEKENGSSDTSIARSGETHRQSEWRDELFKTGTRGKGGSLIEFLRIEPLSGTKYIQAVAETKEDKPKKVLVVFGPEHAPLEQRIVENAWQEAKALKPDILLFCAFQFDNEAAKDIDELTPEKAEMQLLKAQMNTDLLTNDLRKKRSSNESFWLVGQPDIEIHKIDDGKVQVEVMGFDYYNPKTGNVESGGKKNIAMWMLDTDYDNRSLFPSQVFFPMAGAKDGWAKLAKNLNAEIDSNKIDKFNGTESLPFIPGQTIAIKIIDDRGIESLRVMEL